VSLILYKVYVDNLTQQIQTTCMTKYQIYIYQYVLVYISRPHHKHEPRHKLGLTTLYLLQLSTVQSPFVHLLLTTCDVIYYIYLCVVNIFDLYQHMHTLFYLNQKCIFTVENNNTNTDRLMLPLLERGRWFSSGIPVSSTNKTDRHDITEILLKVGSNTLTLTLLSNYKSSHFYERENK